MDGPVYAVEREDGGRLGVVAKRRHRGVGGFGRYRHQSWAHTCWTVSEPVGLHRVCYDSRRQAVEQVLVEANRPGG